MVSTWAGLNPKMLQQATETGSRETHKSPEMGSRETHKSPEMGSRETHLSSRGE